MWEPAGGLKWKWTATDRPAYATPMDLNTVRDFLAVAEHGGYAEAGRILGLPKSTLSRRVAALEQSLGVRLIDRNSRRLRLTAEGDALRDRAAGLVLALSALEEQVRPGAAPLKGRLRISVPLLFGHFCLGRIAARFADAHPGVLLEAVVEDRKVDLLREGFDAALRINPSPDGTLSGRLLGRNRLVLVAAPALASRLGYEGPLPRTWCGQRSCGKAGARMAAGMWPEQEVRSGSQPRCASTCLPLWQSEMPSLLGPGPLCFRRSSSGRTWPKVG